MNRDYSIIVEEVSTGIPGEDQVYIILSDGEEEIALTKLPREDGFRKCQNVDEVKSLIGGDPMLHDSHITSEALWLAQEFFESNFKRMKSTVKEIYNLIQTSQDEDL